MRNGNKSNIRYPAVKALLVVLAAMPLAAYPLVAVSDATSGARRAAGSVAEDYVREVMPPGFQVVQTDSEGPVFADARGHTIYKWPQRSERNGFVGDRKNESVCTDEVLTVSAGLMSPYPAGLILPDLEKRPACTQLWPPLLASADSVPVGNWSFVTRDDGRKQWAYDGQALYTSALDQRSGDLLGGTTIRSQANPSRRIPLQPKPNVPPAFRVISTSTGRMVVNSSGYSIYSSDADEPEKSNCDVACSHTWVPMLAPALAQPLGEWTLFERAPGVRQWAFRKRPVYTYARDVGIYSRYGSDVPGWHNVYTQETPKPPAPFTIRDTHGGAVVADAQGRTIYVYNCADDSEAQLACDYPGAPSVYRLAICGGGILDRCLKRWPYVIAAADARSDSQSWSVITIDPRTGNLAQDGTADELRVWAYRGKPIYTFAAEEPGDIKGDSVGEWSGDRNGFNALWIRDDFYRDDT